MCLVMTIVFIEATGMFLALARTQSGERSAPRTSRGLRADAIGTIIGGDIDTFPYVSIRKASASSASPGV